MYDIKSNNLLEVSRSGGPFPQSASWTVGAHNGTGLDAQKAREGVLVVNCDVGTATATIKIQDSPDNSTWTDLAAAKYGTGAAPATISADGVHFFTFKDIARYVRVVVTIATATMTSLHGALFLVKPRLGPFTQNLTEK